VAIVRIDARQADAADQQKCSDEHFHSCDVRSIGRLQIVELLVL